MKWFRRVLVVIVVLACGLIAAVVLTALRSEHPVGFQVTRTTDTGGQPLLIAVWYPTQAHPRPTTLFGPQLMTVAADGAIAGHELPLVVISHGNGGGPGSHADLAMTLASAGYVVAALLHNGDNYADESAVGSASFFSGRSRQLHSTIDYMLHSWQGHDHIDPERIGAFGFSAGGFTVLTAVGAHPELRIVARHCAESPEFACEVLRQARSPLLTADAPTTGDPLLPDPRIKAAVIAAPGLGFTMASNALANVSVPIQLWSADQDVNVPYATNTRLVREALGSRVEFHSVPGAGHFSFLAPCGILRPPGICADAGHFDRKAFHANMNRSVVAFFDRHLSGRASTH